MKFKEFYLTEKKIEVDGQQFKSVAAAITYYAKKGMKVSEIAKKVPTSMTMASWYSKKDNWVDAAPVGKETKVEPKKSEPKSEEKPNSKGAYYIDDFQLGFGTFKDAKKSAWMYHVEIKQTALKPQGVIVSMSSSSKKDLENFLDYLGYEDDKEAIESNDSASKKEEKKTEEKPEAKKEVKPEEKNEKGDVNKKILDLYKKGNTSGNISRALNISSSDAEKVIDADIVEKNRSWVPKVIEMHKDGKDVTTIIIKTLLKAEVIQAIIRDYKRKELDKQKGSDGDVGQELARIVKKLWISKPQFNAGFKIGTPYIEDQNGKKTIQLRIDTPRELRHEDEVSDSFWETKLGKQMRIVGDWVSELENDVWNLADKYKIKAEIYAE